MSRLHSKQFVCPDGQGGSVRLLIDEVDSPLLIVTDEDCNKVAVAIEAVIICMRQAGYEITGVPVRPDGKTLS